MTPIEMNLLEAQQKAKDLFDAIACSDILSPFSTEKDINKAIYNLAFKMFGIRKYWHKRIVRSGRNTLYPYNENPPNLIIKEDDIVFIDFGPVFEEYEADFGRTFILGCDPKKIKIKNDVEAAFIEGKKYYQENENIKASELFKYVDNLAKSYGWEYGNVYCGHQIGVFPHERIEDHEVSSYIHPLNDTRINRNDKYGNQLNWILEIHFIDRRNEFGGFYEDLLTISE